MTTLCCSSTRRCHDPARGQRSNARPHHQPQPQLQTRHDQAQGNRCTLLVCSSPCHTNLSCATNCSLWAGFTSPVRGKTARMPAHRRAMTAASTRHGSPPLQRPTSSSLSITPARGTRRALAASASTSFLDLTPGHRLAQTPLAVRRFSGTHTARCSLNGVLRVQICCPSAHMTPPLCICVCVCPRRQCPGVDDNEPVTLCGW